MAGSILDEIDAALGDDTAPPRPASILDEIDLALSEPDAPQQWQSSPAQPLEVSAGIPDGTILKDVAPRPGDIDPSTIIAPKKNVYDPNPEVSDLGGLAQSAASGIVGGVLGLADQATRVHAAMNPSLLGIDRYKGFGEAKEELSTATKANFPNREWANAMEGAASSITKNALIAATGAGLPGMVASQFEESSIDAGKEADAAGLKGLDKARYVLTQSGTEAALTTIFSKIPGMGGTESALASAFGQTKDVVKKGVLEAAKKLGKTIAAEELEELSIYALQAVSKKLEGVDPAALDADKFLEGAKNVARTTVLSAGAASNIEVAGAKVAEWKTKNQERAAELAAKETLSRKDAEEIGIEGKNNVPNRKTLHEQLKATFNAPPVDLPPQPRDDRRASLEDGMQGPPAETPAPPVPAPEPTPVERVHAMVKEDGTPPVKDEVVKALGVTREEAGALIKQAFPPKKTWLDVAEENNVELKRKPNFFNAVNLNKNTLPLPDQTPALEKVSFNEPVQPNELPLPEDKSLPPLLKPGEKTLEEYTVPELRELAKKRGIKVPTGIGNQKAALIKALDGDRRAAGGERKELRNDLEEEAARILGKTPGRPGWADHFMEGKQEEDAGLEAVHKHLQAHPEDKGVFIGNDIINQKGQNKHFKDDIPTADKMALQPQARILKEEIESVPGVKQAIFARKPSSDEWSVFAVGDITPEVMRAAAERAHARVVEHMKTVGITEEHENPRAPKPKYNREEMSEKNQKIYDKDHAEYLKGRGVGFRIAVQGIGPGDTTKDLWSLAAEQHTAQKESMVGDVKGIKPEAPGTVAPPRQRGGVAEGAQEGRGRTEASEGGAKREGIPAAAAKDQSQPKVEVAEDLRKQADEVPRAESLGSLGGNVVGDEVVLRNNESVRVRPAPRPEFEAALQASKGAKKQTTLEYIKEVADSLMRKATRAQEHIPDTPENVVANDALRRLKDTPNIAMDDTVRNIAAVTFKMEAPQADLFGRFLVIKNLQEALSRAEPGRFTASDKTEVDQYAADLEKDVSANKVVKEAVENRQKLVKEFVTELQDNGMLPPDMDREWYYHQQVLSKVKQSRAAAGGMKPKIIKRAFQKERIKAEGLTLLAAEYDYNTDYIEAEVTWMAEAKMELLKKGILKEITDKFDVAPKQKDDGSGLGEDEEVEIPKGHSWWSPGPGNMFHTTLSAEEKAAAALQDNILAESGLSEEDMQAVNAINGRNRFLLPDHIVAQLELMEKAKPSSAELQLFKDLTSGWKGWTLGAPHKIIPAQMRNALGDLDSTFAGAPGVLKVATGVTGEVWDYYAGKKLAMSPDLTKARDLGVLQSSMTVQEVPDAKDLVLFKRFYGQQNLLARSVQGYIEKTKQYASFREATLRYAAFKYFRDQLDAGTLKYYGASNEANVKALAKDAGNDKAAAKLARELVGDYGNLSVMSQWLRDYPIPFWSYAAINAVRYKNFVKNILKGKGTARETAIVGTAAAVRLGAAYAMFQAINHLFFPDEEKKLSAGDRQTPHLIAGTYPDGSIRLIRNVGAIGDVLEWAGLNTLASLYSQWRDGQISTAHLATEMAKDPFNKVVQGLHPGAKGGIEITTGQSWFPDAANPRSVDRDVAAANVLGLGDFYSALKGLVLKDGSRARPHTVDRMFTGVSDPNQNALSEIYDLGEKFLQKSGSGSTPGDPNFKNMRRAAGANDYKAFKEAKALYLESGKKLANFKDALGTLDPISRIKKKDRNRFEQEFLSDPQRLKLKTARDYAASLEDSLRAFWWRSEDEK